MNFLLEMKESVVNFEFYNILRKNSYKRVFAYLAILVLVIFSIGSVKTWLIFDSEINNWKNKFKNEFPEFSMSNGVLNWSGDSVQYLVKEETTAFLIDINKTISLDEMNTKYQSYMVFYKDQAVIKNDSRLQTIFYKEFSAGIQSNINKKFIIGFLENLKVYIIFVLIFIFPFIYALKLLNVVVLASIAVLIGKFMNVKFTWKEYFLISAYSLTLPMLLGLFFDLAGVSFHWLIFWLISLVYVVMALRAYRPEETGIL